MEIAERKDAKIVTANACDICGAERMLRVFINKDAVSIIESCPKCNHRVNLRIRSGLIADKVQTYEVEDRVVSTF